MTKDAQPHEEGHRGVPTIRQEAQEAMRAATAATTATRPELTAAAKAATEEHIRALESELRALKAAEDRESRDATLNEEDDEEMEDTAVKLRMLPLKEQQQDGEARELFDAPVSANMDPFSCFFMLVPVCYVQILHESRTIKNGEVQRSMMIVGPHWIGVVVTLAIILVATIAFLKQQCTTLAWYYTLFTLGFCYMTLYYLFETSCRDPGIILPRWHRDTKSAEDDEDDAMESGGRKGNHNHQLLSPRNGDHAHQELQSDVLSQRSSAVTSLPSAPSRFFSTTSAGDRTRLCDICGVQQDQYTEHCDDCDVCIDEYDHHCPWMGKCIGRKNLRAFKLFNLSWVLYVVFVLAVAIQNVEWTDMAIERLERTASGSWMPVSSRSHQP